MSVILLTTGITDTKCLLVTHVSQSLPSVVNRKNIYPIRRETFLKRTSSLCVHGKAAGIQCWLTMVEQGKLPIPVLTGTAYTTEHGKQNKPWLKKRKLPGTRDRSHARPMFMWWRGEEGGGDLTAQMDRKYCLKRFKYIYKQRWAHPSIEMYLETKYKYMLSKCIKINNVLLLRICI